MEIDILKSYITELLKGSHKDFNAIYNMYADKLYGFAFAHTKSSDMSNDIIQDTFLKLLTMRESILTNGSLLSLHFTMSHYKMTDNFRAQINKVEFEDYIEYCENFDFGDNAIEKKLFYDDFLKALKMCKNLLPLRHLEIFEMSREMVTIYIDPCRLCR